MLSQKKVVVTFKWSLELKNMQESLVVREKRKNLGQDNKKKYIKIGEKNSEFIYRDEMQRKHFANWITKIKINYPNSPTPYN